MVWRSAAIYTARTAPKILINLHIEASDNAELFLKLTRSEHIHALLLTEFNAL